MAKRNARQPSSSRQRRSTSSDSLQVLEQRVIDIAEQLDRLVADAQTKAEHSLEPGAYQAQLENIRTGASGLIERLRATTPGGNGDRRMARDRSRVKVAAPGKKHRKPPEAAATVKHSDQRISKAIATRRRTSGRPREG